MKNYLNFKSDIQGYKDVLDTVKTVEKISASSIHDLKIKVRSLQLYKQAISELLHRLSIFNIKIRHRLLQHNNTHSKWLVIIGSEKGLVGGLNHNLINALAEHTKNYQKFIVVGRKINSFLEEEGLKAEKVFDAFSDIPSSENIKTCTDYLFSNFNAKQFSSLDIIYPGFISISEQNPVIVPFLPFNFIMPGTNDSSQTSDIKIPEGLPIFEPSKQIIFDRLLEKYIGIYFYEIMLEAKLSELSARTVSMENSSEKTKKFITKLRLTYLKERKKYVTQKQLESFIIHKIT